MFNIYPISCTLHNAQCLNVMVPKSLCLNVMVPKSLSFLSLGDVVHIIASVWAPRVRKYLCKLPCCICHKKSGMHEHNMYKGASINNVNFNIMLPTIRCLKGHRMIGATLTFASQRNGETDPNITGTLLFLVSR